jgi:hypothetical protein
MPGWAHKCGVMYLKYKLFPFKTCESGGMQSQLYKSFNYLNEWENALKVFNYFQGMNDDTYLTAFFIVFKQVIFWLGKIKKNIRHKNPWLVKVLGKS